MNEPEKTPEDELCDYILNELDELLLEDTEEW